MTTSVTDTCVRLEANRARLRLHLSTAPKHSQDSARAHSSLYATYLVGLLAAFAHSGTPKEALVAWWKTLPMAQTLGLAESTVQSWILPTAQRHPVRLVLGAMLAGAVVTWLRPWQWLPANALKETFKAGAGPLSGFVDLMFRHQGPTRP